MSDEFKDLVRDALTVAIRADKAAEEGNMWPLPIALGDNLFKAVSVSCSGLLSGADVLALTAEAQAIVEGRADQC
ncbi:hypothetical protein [Saccharomonospora iraqiensis]|uniref:hypothetical protein n=1 Tax=Saccharomonospora iraqiensis TaxID=52698 RepID=UPI0004787DB3|nr:hypothetical protein [Saccharomonospora iraqiensis]